MNFIIQVVLVINILVRFQHSVCDSNPPTNNVQEKIVNDVLKCLRGPEECQIDRIHACTSAIYRNDSYMLGKFFICMMMNAQQINAAPQCAAEANFNWGEIEGCSKTDRAAEFCQNRFEVLNKYHVRMVPGIFYNKKYNKEVDQQSCNNLKGVICEKLAALSVSFEGCNC